MLDPALFPDRVPVAVAYMAMGGGVVSGILLTHLIWLLAHQPGQEQDAELIDRDGRAVLDGYPTRRGRHAA